MYDPTKRVELHYATVGKLVELLQQLPRDADLFCCGDYQFYLHVSADGRTVSIDSSPLDEEYDDAEE